MHCTCGLREPERLHLTCAKLALRNLAVSAHNAQKSSSYCYNLISIHNVCNYCRLFWPAGSSGQPPGASPHLLAAPHLIIIAHHLACIRTSTPASTNQQHLSHGQAKKQS